MRSQFIEDAAGLVVGGRKYSLFSANGELGFSATKTDLPELWRYCWSRKLNREYRLGDPVVIQYIDIAIITTALSAYLLLSKPRATKTAAKPVESP